MIGTRLKAIIVKEFWAMMRDPRSRIILIAPPLLQLFLFGFASTMEVNNIRVGVLDHDHGRWSREVVERLAGSPNVKEILLLHSEEQMRDAINRQRVIVALRFDPRFSADVETSRGALIGAVYDGRRSNAAQIVASYVQRIAAETGASVSGGPPAAAPSMSVANHWFNPNLDYMWFVMPALIVILAAVSALGVVSQAVAREKELGTFDQLMVSPLRTHELLIGKMIPPVIVGLANVTLFVVLVPTVFGVPLTGSIALFYIALLFYLLSVTAIGMLISTVSSTQQQGFLGMFVVSVPMIILSGYASPVDNMPGWLQVVTWFNPPAWFLTISEGTFLKAMPASAILANTWPIVLIAIGATLAAATLFRSRME